jgi:hypothetical protein
MLVARRTSCLALAAGASAVLLLTLLAAALISRDRVRIAQIGCGGASVAVGARYGSVALQLRRRHTFGGLQVPAGWRAFTTSYSSSSPLAAMCIRQHGERWLLPGLWLGAGRDTYVHYADVLFPPWLTIPACLILPSISYHRRRHRPSRGFAVLPRNVAAQSEGRTKIHRPLA